MKKYTVIYTTSGRKYEMTFEEFRKQMIIEEMGYLKDIAQYCNEITSDEAKIIASNVEKMLNATSPFDMAFKLTLEIRQITVCE